jgi:hypothetical protein
MDNFPKYLTQNYDEETEQYWFTCRACGAPGTAFFNWINMAMEARAHARTCPAKQGAQRAAMG